MLQKESWLHRAPSAEQAVNSVSKLEDSNSSNFFKEKNNEMRNLQ
jgi:hypothetical protein